MMQCNTSLKKKQERKNRSPEPMLLMAPYCFVFFSKSSAQLEQPLCQALVNEVSSSVSSVFSPKPEINYKPQTQLVSWPMLQHRPANYCSLRSGCESITLFINLPTVWSHEVLLSGRFTPPYVKSCYLLFAEQPRLLPSTH